MDFVRHTLRCTQKLMCCQENNIKFQLDNPQQKFVKLYKVDGGLISGVGIKKCDYMYEIFNQMLDIKKINAELNDDNKSSLNIESLIYVELKGKNFEKAAKQIEITADQLQARHSHCNKKLGYIVCSRIQHPKFQTVTQRLKMHFMKKYGIKLQIGVKVETLVV
ncbi:hypothetical protein AAFM81_003697 [Vibrio fluvialis]|nr:hypothetical protein [Vibrio fluvialis]ELH4236537.1 hypothetical protein [Vibrio fluvialis]